VLTADEPALAGSASRRRAAGATSAAARGLGILAGAAVFVAALAVPLDDPALVMALVIAVRGGRAMLYVDS
jgi:hypothetical protein